MDDLERQLLEEALIRKAREDINVFVSLVMRDPSTRKHFVQSKCHRLMQRHIDTHNKCTIWAHRSLGKTSQAIARVLWWLGRDPNERIKIVCANDDLAKQRVTEIRSLITGSEVLHRVFPHLREDPKTKDWSKMSITVEREVPHRDPSVEAAGVRTIGTGGRATILLFDDVCDFSSSIAYPKLRELVKKNFYEVWLNLLDETDEKPGKIVYLSTPWHQLDLSCELKKNKTFPHIEFAVVERDGRLISPWPEKWTHERLAERRREIGEVAFNRNFKLIPIAEEDQIFDHKWVLSSIDRTVESTSKMFENMRKFVGVDMAIGKSDEACYSVLTVVAVDKNNHRYVLDVVRGRFSNPELASRVIDVYEYWSPDIILVESNFFQRALIQWLDTLGVPEMPIEPYETRTQKHSLDIGLPSLALEFEKGMWTIVVDHEPRENCECGKCALVRELTQYPYGDYTDTLMALWFSKEAIRRMRPKGKRGSFEVWDLAPPKEKRLRERGTPFWDVW